MSPYKSISQRSGSRRQAGNGRPPIPIMPMLVGVILGAGLGFFIGYIIRLQVGSPNEPAKIVVATPLPTMSRQKVQSEMKDMVRESLENVSPGGPPDRLLKLDEDPDAIPTLRLQDIGR